MSHWKSVFNYEWCDPQIHPEWALWIFSDPNNPYVARCKFCCKSFSLSNMGATAVRSHAKGKSHLKRQAAWVKQLDPQHHLEDGTIQQLPECSKSALVAVVNSPPQEVVLRSRDVVPRSFDIVGISGDSFVSSRDVSLTQNAISRLEDVEIWSPSRQETSESRDQESSSVDILKAEIIWIISCVMNNVKISSCKENEFIFKTMFPDSHIAKNFEMNAMKASYIITYCLSPYFKEHLYSRVENSVGSSVCFSECVNKVSEQNKMDLFIRYWDNDVNKVASRYVSSVFLNESVVSDLVVQFREELFALSPRKILQVSKEGSNVNEEFLKTIKREIQEVSDDAVFMDIGSCDMFNYQEALDTGHNSVNWEIDVFMSDLYRLFKDDICQRFAYSEMTGATSFPLKFYKNNWFKNIPCIVRCIEGFENIKHFVCSKKSINSLNLENIRRRFEDPLMLAKVSFLKTVIQDVYSLVKEFQETEPMIPFLHSQLLNLAKTLMYRYIVKSDVDEISLDTLFNTDFSNLGNIVDVKLTDVGMETKKETLRADVSDTKMLTFYSDCQKFLIKTTKVISTLCPLKCELLHCISAIDPRIIYFNSTTAKSNMSICLKTLYQNDRIDETTFQEAKDQFANLCLAARGNLQQKFQKYLEENIGIENFYTDILAGWKEHHHIWTVVKMLLILSYGNTTSKYDLANAGDVYEELKEDGLVSLWHVYSSVEFLGGVLGVELNDNLLRYATDACVKYNVALQEKQILQREKETRLREQEKRKRILELQRLHAKKLKLNIEHCAKMEEIEAEIEALEKKVNP